MEEIIGYSQEVAAEKELYWKMYAILCGAASDAIDALQDSKNNLYARNLLEQAILQTETLYISHGEEKP